MILLLVGLLLVAPVLVILHLTRFWRAFPLILLLGGLSFYAYVIVARDDGHVSAVLAACLTPAAIVAFALWRPASSKFALWVADGLTGAAICAKWMGLGGSIVTLASAQLNVVGWLSRGWWIVAIGIAGWIIEGLMSRHVLASVGRERGGMERLKRLSGLNGR